MKKAIALLGIIIVEGCSSPVNIPLPKDHPAYGFYQTANAFNVSSSSCTKLKGIVTIQPDKIGANQPYEKLQELAPGIFKVREKISGHEFLTVFFMEYFGTASIPKTCSWDAEKFPIRESKLNLK